MITNFMMPPYGKNDVETIPTQHQCNNVTNPETVNIAQEDSTGMYLLNVSLPYF